MMTKIKLMTRTLPVLFGAVLMAPVSYAETFTLDGKSLTVETLQEAALPGNDVRISKEGWSRIKKSYDISIDATKHGKTVYGLNVNFGELKDQQVVNGDVTKEPMRSASIAFNERQMRIQAAGVGPFLANDIVKMSMIIRLNQMAAGLTGMTTDAANAFIQLVNNDANPLIPSRGSMGLNDLAWPTHIGLALMGEWDINYKGERRDAKEVLKALGMKKFRPFGLDGISILSNANVSMAILVDAMQKADKIINYSPYLIAAGLETLNGNVSPFLWHSVEGKGMPKGHEAAEAILLSLKGSYLWDKNEQRSLQDALSFRSAHWTLATALNEMDRLKNLINIQINHTSDNPLVTIAGKSDLWYSDTPVVKHYAVDPSGATRDYINSNSAFDFTQIALQTESTIKAMAHLLHGSGWRIMQVDDSRRTHMSKYLSAKSNVTNGVHGDGFANIGQPMVGLYAEAMSLTNNVTLYGMPTSGGIEEMYSNVNLTADRLRQMANVGAEILSFETLHMTQGAQMRRDEQGYELGEGTKRLLKAYRKVVPFVDKDRAYTKDINNGVQFIKNVQLESLYQ